MDAAAWFIRVAGIIEFIRFHEGRAEQACIVFGIDDRLEKGCVKAYSSYLEHKA